MILFRAVLTFFLFAARAFISGAFQAAYVYTPEVSLLTHQHVMLMHVHSDMVVELSRYVPLPVMLSRYVPLPVIL